MLEDINRIRLFVEGIEGGATLKYFQKKLGFNKQDIQEHTRYLDEYKLRLTGFEESLKNRHKWDLAPVFITGMPRAGTSLLTYLMKHFEGCNVVTHTEHSYHMLFDNNMQVGVINVVKQPYGYFEDFSKYTYKSLIDRGIRIISIVRDPRDVLVSRHELDRSKYWVDPKIVKRCAKEHIKNMSNWFVLSLRYEDLVENPKSVMDKIGRFLGRKYSKFDDFYSHVDRTTPMAKALNGPRPIDKNSIGNWKSEEHKTRVEEIMDRELIDYIQKLGYEV